MSANSAALPPFLQDPLAPRRRPTRVVRVGDVPIGGDHPIVVQSMTTTDTLDTKATADEAECLAAAGCEIVRITAPSIRDAENLEAIARELEHRRVHVPLVADIHFTPNAALIAAEYVHKVRVNPGNYADKKKFEVREYSDAQYEEELERVAERFRPLVLRCRELGRAMRIGTNHGSLSDRIMNRYGDTPLGMVESALEFLDVCEAENYRDIVFSMKASNAQVAIQAYRLLASRLAERSAASGEPDYPFHVGVTEAGDGEDGRVKSAIGIGALLEDGIGDTVRVSLTEDPVKEIPVARALADRAMSLWAGNRAEGGRAQGSPIQWVDDPFAHARRPTPLRSLGGMGVGGTEPVRVEVERDLGRGHPGGLAAELATQLAMLEDIACESLCVRAEDAEAQAELPELLAQLESLGVSLPVSVRIAPGVSVDAEALSGAARVILEVSAGSDPPVASLDAVGRLAVPVELCLSCEPTQVAAEFERLRARVAERLPGVSFVSVDPADGRGRPHAVRALAAALRAAGEDWAIALRHRRDPARSDEDAALDASIDFGAPLCDGLGDLVSIAGGRDAARDVDLAYRVLQGARLRTTRTEYISCPSCGRTLFDLEETTARVKQATGHLKGVKIAVMGCIVNGPGEMADADFGYVGSGPGVVNLYVGHDVVERAVPEGEAPERLVRVIRENGAWQERGAADSDG